MYLARISLALVTVPISWLAVASADAGGWREEQSWQFRSPAETQTKLNSESLRLQTNGVTGAGAQNGSIILPSGLSAGAAGTGGSSTLGNSTTGVATYSVTINGSNNQLTVDGYLNLDTDQHTGSQDSRSDTQIGAGQ